MKYHTETCESLEPVWPLLQKNTIFELCEVVEPSYQGKGELVRCKHYFEQKMIN